MISERAGHFSLCYGDNVYESPYYTFTPHSLCRDIMLKVDDELLGLLANTHRQLGLLEGSCRHIDCMENITRLFLLREVATSYAIDESSRFTFPELFGIIRDKKRGQQLAPVLNHIAALEYGIGELRRFRLTRELICATHGILMAHRRDTQVIGAIRKKQTILGEFIVHVANMKTYNPTEPAEIKACMADMQKYIQCEDGIDPLIKAALLHYQLQAIHPFESGNGKIGRVLIAQHLFDACVLRHTILPISEFLLMNKVEYFDRLDAVHHRGSYEQWIQFFLKALAVTAEATIASLEKAVLMREANLARIHAYSKDIGYLLEAYGYVEKSIYLDTKTLSEAIGVSYNTAARIVSELVELDILKQSNHQTRNRRYCNYGLLDAVGIGV